MQEFLQFYIDGQWVDPVHSATIDVVNPANGQKISRISNGSGADVDAAVAAAKQAFAPFAATSVQERASLLDRIIEIYKRRMPEIGAMISAEMGAPIGFANRAQAGSGLAHFVAMRKIIEHFDWIEDKGKYTLVHEPVGVCGLITPWNWPQNQIACKVAPALAAGCTMVLKPRFRRWLSCHHPCLPSLKLQTFLHS